MRLKITEILSVVDTRTWEEGSDDKWHPVPGSGDLNPCARCNRLHEVHATVLLSNGQTLVVGTGCMRKEDPETARRFLRADRAAKRLAALKAELIAREALWDAYRAAQVQVDALTPPPIEETWETRQVGRSAGDSFPTITMGDAVVWCSIQARDDHASMSRSDRAEREDCVLRSWKVKRIAERGFNHRPRDPEYTRKEIRKVQARLEAIQAEHRGEA